MATTGSWVALPKQPREGCGPPSRCRQDISNRRTERRRTTTLDFTDVDTPAPEYKIPAEPHLARFGVSIEDPNPSQTRVGIWNKSRSLRWPSRLAD